MPLPSNLYNLRDKKGKLNIAVIQNGDIMLSNEVGVIEKQVLEQLSSLIHERDKLVLVSSTFLLGNNDDDFSYLVINTSMKMPGLNKKIVCIESLSLRILDKPTINAIIIGELVVSIDQKSVKSVKLP